MNNIDKNSEVICPGCGTDLRYTEEGDKVIKETIKEIELEDISYNTLEENLRAETKELKVKYGGK